MRRPCLLKPGLHVIFSSYDAVLCGSQPWTVPQNKYISFCLHGTCLGILFAVLNKTKTWQLSMGLLMQGTYYVMLKKRAGVFLDSIKHVLRVFWTASKTFLKKRVSIDFITIMLSWMLEICIWEKHFRYKLVCKKIKSDTCFEFFFHKPKRTWRPVPELFGSRKVPRLRGI